MSALAAPPVPTRAEREGAVVSVLLEDGARLDLHELALRDACPCEECRHPVSGQRLFETGRVVPAARLAAAAVADGRLLLTWEDGHESAFDGRLLDETGSAAARSRGPAPSLWGAELASTLPIWSHDEIVSDRAALGGWLRAVARLGFAVLTGVPLEGGAVARVAGLFGFVRETNYGRVFDVEVRADATNLADTASALSLHTDNPYRVPTPSLQLLHCLASSVGGGDTVLSDGFRAVTRLREDDPGKLELLARTPVRHAYRDASAELSADVTVVELDATGAPAAVRVNNRAKGVPVGPPETVAGWYEGYFELLRLLDAPDARVVFRLRAGDLIVFDNLRVLHARTAFSSAGARRLQGCYSDMDGLLSTLAVLERDAS